MRCEHGFTGETVRLVVAAGQRQLVPQRFLQRWAAHHLLHQPRDPVLFKKLREHLHLRKGCNLTINNQRTCRKLRKACTCWTSKSLAGAYVRMYACTDAIVFETNN